MSRFAIAVAWLITGLSASFSAQGLRLERKSSYVTPRTPWGHPDLQGRWTNATVTPLERPTDLGDKEFFTEAEAAEVLEDRARAVPRLDRFHQGERDQRRIRGRRMGRNADDRADPPHVAHRRTDRTAAGVDAGRACGTAALAAARKADLAESPEERTLGERCLWFLPEGPPMLPGVTYNSNYEIVQTPTHVAIQIEMGNGFRIIPLDGRPTSAATRSLMAG